MVKTIILLSRTVNPRIHSSVYEFERGYIPQLFTKPEAGRPLGFCFYC